MGRELTLDGLVARAGGLNRVFGARKEGGAEKTLERVMRQSEGVFRFFGFRLERVAEGLCTITFPFSKNVKRWGGIVHGGAVMTVLDYACGIAVMTINPERNQVTAELKINFLERLHDGPFSASGKVIRAGRTTVVVDGEVRDAKGRLCAKSLGTWYILADHG